MCPLYLIRLWFIFYHIQSWFSTVCVVKFDVCVFYRARGYRKHTGFWQEKVILNLCRIWCLMMTELYELELSLNYIIGGYITKILSVDVVQMYYRCTFRYRNNWLLINKMETFCLWIQHKYSSWGFRTNIRVECSCWRNEDLMEHTVWMLCYNIHHVSIYTFMLMVVEVDGVWVGSGKFVWRPKIITWLLAGRMMTLQCVGELARSHYLNQCRPFIRQTIYTNILWISGWCLYWKCSWIYHTQCGRHCDPGRNGSIPICTCAVLLLEVGFGPMPVRVNSTSTVNVCLLSP